jgi:GMP synthase (glutamine-hydrolysing)
VNVLAVVHGANAPPGSFADVVARRGHLLETWSLAWGTPPPRPIDDYGAVMLFGGAMHADEERFHPWLREEHLFIERLLDLHVPLLGVCLGAQLIAKAAHARVCPAAEPEIGWAEVELTDEAADDPVFTELPPRFPAFQWHYYAFDVPAGACELAWSRVCPQAFRLGDAAWGVQFHPEVTSAIVSGWVDEWPEEVPGRSRELLAETDARMEEWTGLGRSLCGAFVRAAERVAVPAVSSQDPVPARPAPMTCSSVAPVQRSAGSSSWRDHSCHEPR